MTGSDMVVAKKGTRLPGTRWMISSGLGAFAC